MKVFVVYYYLHEDDYKRADTDGDVIGVFSNQDEAYKCAVKEFLNYFIPLKIMNMITMKIKIYVKNI